MNRSFWGSFGFLLALGSGFSAKAQDSDQFEFRLHGARVGEVTFFNTTPVSPAPIESDLRSPTTQGQIDALSASGKTRGMVHWFKNYAATFHSTMQPNGNRTYRVIAVDANVPETRHIEFPIAPGSTPLVIDFSDRTQAQPLPVDPLLDQDRIDPLSVLQKVLRQVNQVQTCDAVYRVYDGKRRYTVLTSNRATGQRGNEDLIDAAAARQAPPKIQCEITLQTETDHQTGLPELESAGLQADASSTNRRKSAGFWPFKKLEQTMMMIEFKQDSNGYRFAAFDINSPFGTIKGRPVS